MRRASTTSATVCLVVVTVLAADAVAMLNPATGRFVQRDPVGTLAPSLLSWNPSDSHLEELPLAAQRANSISLYQYVYNNPAKLTDPTGFIPVDPAKDCGLSSNSNWSGKKPVHYWVKGFGEELWDYGPDYDYLRTHYGNTDYSFCGIFKYCRGEANWGNNAYARQTGRHAHNPLKLQGGFLFFEAKLRTGPKKGTRCQCATCDDIKGCLDAVRNAWNGTRYYHLERNCATFLIDAMGKCCLKE